MLRTRSTIILLAILLVAIVACAAVREVGATSDSEAYAAGIYDRVTPELIALYEKEISACPVVSDQNPARLLKTAEGLGIELNKLKALMLLQDLSARVGREISLSALAEKSEWALILYAKQCGDDYLAALPEEQRQRLKKLLFEALKPSNA